MISVVMAAYNAEKYITEAIASILVQTYPNFELIVTDDGSQDSTVEIISNFIKQDPRVRLVMMEHVGACAARNAAIAQAKCDWIAVMDADDIAVPHRLERQIEAAESDPEVILWGAYLTRVTSTGEPIDLVRLGPTSKEAYYRIDKTKDVVHLYNSTAFFKKDAFLMGGGYDARITVYQDSELWDRMTLHGPAVVIPESLIYYRQHEASITATTFETAEMYYSFILERNRARHHGRDLDLDDYISSYDVGKGLRAVFYYMRSRSLVHSTKALIAFAEKKRLKGMHHALIGGFMDPVRIITGLPRIIGRFLPIGKVFGQKLTVPEHNNHCSF